jgi:hypothetical protein
VIRRQIGAGNLRGLDSVPNSCSAGPRSQLRWPLEIPVQVQSDSRQKARPGTEFLDAETGRQKSPLEPTNAHRDKNPGMEWPEIRAETPYLASYRKRPVCGDWMVVCPVRCKPVSDCITGQFTGELINARSDRPGFHENSLCRSKYLRFRSRKITGPEREFTGLSPRKTGLCAAKSRQVTAARFWARHPLTWLLRRAGQP